MIIQQVVVIYNRKCDASISVQALLKQSCKPVIIDNSTEDYGNNEFCKNHGLLYISMDGNKGLSKAYNKAISFFSGKVKYIQWFDDDTEIPDGFIIRAEQFVVSHPMVDVFVPVVISGNNKEILSPNRMRKAYTYKVEDIQELKAGEFSAINSGMIVNTDVYRNYRYDERMFLDCIDNDFMCYCWKNNVEIDIVKDLKLIQNFSGDEKGNKKASLMRFRIFARDFRIFRRKNHCSILSTEYILMKLLINIVLC